jgi:hypothetical protein
MVDVILNVSQSDDGTITLTRFSTEGSSSVRRAYVRSISYASNTNTQYKEVYTDPWVLL